MNKARQMLTRGDCGRDESIAGKSGEERKASLLEIIRAQKFNEMTGRERMRWLNGEFK